MKRKTGTKEWAEHNKNIDVGCRNGCRYCYAQHNAVDRFGHVKDIYEWLKPRRHSNEHEKPKKLNGRIMFPTTHDICPENVDRVIAYLDGWLKEGNEVLIVSKPHFSTIEKMCDWLKQYKSQITFRFTIGTLNEQARQFWEPHAPTIAERILALQLASRLGFKTSVSCEPYYDKSIESIPGQLLMHITDSLWIGKMNKVHERVHWEIGDNFDIHADYWGSILQEVSTSEYVLKLYNTFKDVPNIKWKDSIKEVLGLPEEQIG